MDIEKAWSVFMEDTEKFFDVLGSRIAERRKELHLTQEELGQTLKVTQQEIASYEKGQRRIPVSRLPALAEALSLTVEELIHGMNGGPRKRGPSTKFQRQFELLSRLPRNEQEFVSKFLENILQKAAVS